MPVNAITACVARSRGAEQTQVSVAQWLERDVSGRHTPQEIEQALDAMSTTGEFTWPGSAEHCRVIDDAAFAAQLAQVRARSPELLTTELPDHWLGEY